jgi:predicted AAA+ superfamily ATPase
MFEATRFTAPCEVSRPTVTSYLNVLEATRAVHVVRPFSTHRATEVISAPKVDGFDTGFVCRYRGWTELRPEDLGDLWEHYVLNELHGQTQRRRVRYWRDKRGMRWTSFSPAGAIHLSLPNASGRPAASTPIIYSPSVTNTRTPPIGW